MTYCQRSSNSLGFTLTLNKGLMLANTGSDGTACFCPVDLDAYKTLP